MNGIADFATKAVDFYLSAPTFFNWAAPLLLGAIGFLIWFAYFLGGKLSESENRGVKAENSAIEQRLKLAQEQAAISAKETEQLKTQVEALQKNIEDNASQFELQKSAAALDHNLNRIVSANEAAKFILKAEPGQFKVQGRESFVEQLRRSEKLAKR